jgi:hypothetical protein
MDKTIDWEYDDLLEVTAKDIQKFYNCEIEDAEEAMIYINEFIKDVDKEYESVK